MDENALAERLNRLEEGLRSLQKASSAEKASDAVTTKFQRLCQFVLRNWVLLSFVVAMLTAVYVKFAFGVDYLREYRSIKTKHDLSDLHTQMGDILMGRGEWEAAEDAYRNAQQINPDSLAATRGMVKAQVFKPPAGEKYYVPEVVDAKLDYLLSLYPDDDQLLFLKGTRSEDQGDDKEAIAWFLKAAAKNPKSLGAYSSLGFHYLGRKYFDIDLAIKNLEKAVESDPYFPVANLNLGYAYILTFNSNKALQHLNKSYKTSPKWSSAYRYTVTVYSMDEKKAFTYFATSLDLAMKNEFDKADKDFEAAVKFDKDREYFVYFAYAIRSIENLCAPNAAANNGLKATGQGLADERFTV